MELTKAVKKFALGIGADIVGVGSVERLEKVTPTDQKPLKLLSSGKSVISYGVHMLRGVIESGDVRLRRYNAVEACRVCDEIGVKLAYFLERKGFDSLVIHADVPVDFEKGGMSGDLSLKRRRRGGVGRDGALNELLCEDYGARVYLGAVLTSALLIPDKKVNKQLCKREKCGLCVKACPVGAIRGDDTKDHKLCMNEAMPFGLRNILRQFNRIVKETDTKKQADLIYSPDTFNAWQSLLPK